MNFGLIGLGFISDRHIKAIKNNGGNLIFVCDNDINKLIENENIKGIESVASYKSLFYMDDINLDYISICTPNYLHYKIIKTFYERNKDIKIICEKPLCITREEYDSLLKMEDNGYDVNVTLQLRYSNYLNLIRGKIKNKIDYDNEFFDIDMKILVHRGAWYFNCWKGIDEQSGGLEFNIGVHYFDFVCNIFGIPESFKIYEKTPRQSRGVIHFKNAKLNWELSIQQPEDKQQRYLKIVGDKGYVQELELTKLGFESLHDKCYHDIIVGNGVKAGDIGPVMDLLFSMKEEL